jgi:hypothetical protein
MGRAIRKGIQQRPAENTLLEADSKADIREENRKGGEEISILVGSSAVSEERSRYYDIAAASRGKAYAPTSSPPFGYIDAIRARSSMAVKSSDADASSILLAAMTSNDPTAARAHNRANQCTAATTAREYALKEMLVSMQERRSLAQQIAANRHRETLLAEAKLMEEVVRRERLAIFLFLPSAPPGVDRGILLANQRRRYSPDLDASSRLRSAMNATQTSSFLGNHAIYPPRSFALDASGAAATGGRLSSLPLLLHNKELDALAVLALESSGLM